MTLRRLIITLTRSSWTWSSERKVLASNGELGCGAVSGMLISHSPQWQANGRLLSFFWSNLEVRVLSWVLIMIRLSWIDGRLWWGVRSIMPLYVISFLSMKVRFLMKKTNVYPLYWPMGGVLLASFVSGLFFPLILYYFISSMKW